MDITDLAGDKVPKIHSQTIADVEEAQDYAEAEGWDLRYIQLSPGSYTARYQSLALPGLYLSLKTHRCPALHGLGTRPRQLVPIILPVKIGRSLRCQGRAFTEAEAIVFHGRTEQDVLIQQETQLAGVYMTEAAYLAVWRAAFGPDAEMPGARGQDCIIDGPATAALKEHVARIFMKGAVSTDRHRLGTDVRTISVDIGNLLVMALSSVDWDKRQRLAGNSRQVRLHARRAREIMEAKRHEPLGLTELSAEVGISVRTLQYAFQNYFGISPTRYHMLRRLTGAHADLRRSEPSEASVTDIAFRWGFFHLGRFSMAYGKHFGEVPSKTLAQRQPRLFRTQRSPAARKPVHRVAAPPVSSTSAGGRA
ncbi:MAG: helix-turn-helix transcriptional regulator [Kiloniellales bacterium]|nr:helix-turn-helix transcriptional regulator [Kiloniellales bacterium]